MKLTRQETTQLYELIAQGMRPCRQCERILPLSAFHKAKREIGGVVSRCKECARSNYQANKEEISGRQAKYRSEHREEILAKKKAYYCVHREECLGQMARYRESRHDELAAKQRAYYQRTRAERHAYEASRRDSRVAYNKGWREAHVVEVVARMGKWRVTHKEEMRETQRRYLQTPEGKVKNRRAAHVRKARMRAVPHTFSSKDWKAVLDRFGHRCAYCDVTGVPLEQEHVVPLVKGGGYVVGNIVPACTRCNGSKRTASLEVWAAGRGAAFVKAGAVERIGAYRLGLLGEA